MAAPTAEKRSADASVIRSRREQLDAALTASLGECALPVQELVALVSDYAHSPVWVPISPPPFSPQGHGATPPKWTTYRADEPLPSSGIVSVDVQAWWNESAPAARWQAFGMGIISSESLAGAAARSDDFCVGSLQSFGLREDGCLLHNQLTGDYRWSFARTRPLSPGDVLRATIDHALYTISFHLNGCLLDAMFTARPPIPPSPAGKYSDGRSLVGWPDDGRFYACVSTTSSAFQFRLNDCVHTGAAASAPTLP
jgi:hypothetical protein